MVKFIKDFAALEKWLVTGKRFYTITTKVEGLPCGSGTKQPLQRGTRGHRPTSGCWGPASGERAAEPQAEDITIQTHGYDKCGRINR